MPELRPAREADIPRLMQIRAAVRENRLRDLTIAADAYRPYVVGRRCWVREEDGRIQGFAALDAEAASVWALFVDPQDEGRGAGRALLEVLIADALWRGLSMLALETAPGTRAERLYRRAGWTPAGPGSGSQVRMRLTLDPD